MPASSPGFAEISRKLNPTPRLTSWHVCTVVYQESEVANSPQVTRDSAEVRRGVGLPEPSSLRCPLLSLRQRSHMQSEKLWSQERDGLRGPGTGAGSRKAVLAARREETLRRAMSSWLGPAVRRTRAPDI